MFVTAVSVCTQSRLFSLLNFEGKLTHEAITSLKTYSFIITPQKKMGVRRLFELLFWNMYEILLEIIW